MYKVGDLFCGAGIGAVGAKQAGFGVAYAYDNNKYAVSTYNRNIEDIAQIVDIQTVDYDTIPDSDVITAGFPCQPFSFAGKELGENDPDKGNLGKITLDIIMHKKPKCFFLENVKGLSSKKNMPFLLRLINEFSVEYNVSWRVVNCADYGVPQNRERIFIIGVRKDLESEFVFPAYTHQKNPVTINDAIGDLKIKGDYIANHLVDCGIRNDEKPYVNKIPIGGNWKDLVIEEQKAFMKKGFYSPGGRTGMLYKMNPDKPAKTILSSPMGKSTAQILHWSGYEPRRYTVRESLRLQSVPDWYSFDDSIPLFKQYERCSGIPPIISKLFMTEIKEILDGNRKRSYSLNSLDMFGI